MSDGTTAGSANRNNLGVIPSGPSALSIFRALIFLDMEFSEIETSEIVCISAVSFPASTGAQVGFPERLAPTVAKKVFIRFPFPHHVPPGCCHPVLLGRSGVFSLGS